MSEAFCSWLSVESRYIVMMCNRSGVAVCQSRSSRLSWMLWCSPWHGRSHLTDSVDCHWWPWHNTAPGNHLAATNLLLFHCYSLGGDTAILGMLHTSLLVTYYYYLAQFSSVLCIFSKCSELVDYLLKIVQWNLSCLQRPVPILS